MENQIKTLTTELQGNVKTLKELQKKCDDIDLTKIEVWDENEKGNVRFWGVKPRVKVKPQKRWRSEDVFYKLCSSRRKYRYDDDSLLGSSIIADKSTGEILHIFYSTENIYLNDWLKNTIDPSIPNNYEELHKVKDIEVLITTTTYSQEIVQVKGRTYEECVDFLKKNDTAIRDGNERFNGKKNCTSDTTEYIPQSYDEWLSIKEYRELEKEKEREEMIKNFRENKIII